MNVTSSFSGSWKMFLVLVLVLTARTVRVSAQLEQESSNLRRRVVGDDNNSTDGGADGDSGFMDVPGGLPVNGTSALQPPITGPEGPGASRKIATERSTSHRIWVQYKSDVTRPTAMASLQSQIMTNLGALESQASAALQPDKDGTSDGPASPADSTKTTDNTSTSALPFLLHYDFFDTDVNGVVVTVEDKMLQALENDPTVARISKDEKRYAVRLAEGTKEESHRNLQSEVIPTGVSMVKANKVWAKGYKGQGTTVCVIDSGLDYTHPEFDPSWLGFSTEAGDWWIDGNSHGTHVTGTIAARWKNGQGVVGVAPEATILTFKVFTAEGEWAYSSTVADAAYYCYYYGARVVSMSLGGAPYSQPEYDMFKWLYGQGVVSVAAAGNDGSTSMLYPASYKEVVSVGAVDSSKKLASFSQRNKRVDLVAPGVDVLSTLPVDFGSYGRYSGTSMATPHVSGVAALLLSKNPSASAATIVNAMTSTAQDLGTAGRDNSYGYGFVNALAALAKV